MLQEFQISITPLEQDRYLIRTEKVAPGVPLAEEQVCWPVEDWLEQAKLLMNDPLLRLLQDTDVLQQKLFFPAGQTQSSNLVTLGQQLYDAVFQGSLRDSWIMAQGIAHNQRAVLRLRLGLKGNLLPRLPWEVLHTGGRESLSSCYRPLATGTDIAFSRYQMNAPLGSPTLSFQRAGEEPLKILMAIAGPDDQDRLDLEREARELKAELSNRAEGNLPAIELTILAQPGREELTQALEQGQYHVFHYAGHSGLGDSGGDIYLVSRETKLTQRLSGDDLAGLLANNGVQLAVFNSCRGADTAFVESSDRERNLAQALVKCGIPAVLAMAEQIPDEVALTLTRLFYRNLDRGYPVDLSLSRARQGLISAYSSNQLYWALPVLYLHPNFDGALIHAGDRADLSQEFFELDDPDEIPLALLSENALLTEAEEGEESGELFGSIAQMTERNGNGHLPEASTEDEERAVREILGELTDSKPSQSAIAPSPQPQPRQRPKPKIRPILWIVGGFSALAIALLGLFWLSSRGPKTPLPAAPAAATASLDLSGKNLARVSTEELTGFAIEQMSQGNLEPGARAVKELLNPHRNALDRAEAALACVPPESLDNPAIAFLRGRLAWQSAIAREDSDASIDDARRLWEIALRGAQDNPAQYQTALPLYLNALGFAYYEEGKIERANQSWSEALKLQNQTPENSNAASDPELLNTYAGLALGLKKLSNDEALEFRSRVITQDPLNFRPDSLSQNWLWSQQAIQDWRELMALDDEK